MLEDLWYKIILATAWDDPVFVGLFCLAYLTACTNFVLFWVCSSHYPDLDWDFKEITGLLLSGTFFMLIPFVSLKAPDIFGIFSILIVVASEVFIVYKALYKVRNSRKK